METTERDGWRRWEQRRERENKDRERLICFWEGCWQREKMRNERGINPS